MPGNVYQIKINNPGSIYHEKTINEIAPETRIRDLFPRGVKNKKIAVDASNLIYNSVLATPGVNTLTDKSGNHTGYLKIILDKIAVFAEADIKLVFVFDSPEPNPLKLDEIKRRAEFREQRVSVPGLTDEERERRGFRLSSREINDLKLMLAGIGAEYYEVIPGIEGEQFAAFLTRSPDIGIGEECAPALRECKYVLTNDGDVLMFGGNVLRYARGKKKDNSLRAKTDYTKYELFEILRNMNCSYTDFVKMGVILGTDFNASTPRVGTTAIMKKYSGIELTPEQLNAYNYFMKTITWDMATHTVNKYNPGALVEFLRDGKNFSMETIERALKNIEPVYK